MKKIVSLSLFLSLTAAAAEPALLPKHLAQPPLLTAPVEQPLEVSVDPPAYTQAWFWGMWSIATVQTVLAGLAIAAAYALLSSPPIQTASGTPRGVE